MRYQAAARRCAYLGRWGSFHIINAGGTAAYVLGRGQYIADLAFAGEDQNFWYYSPTNGGDQATAKWAFARQPDRCGRYWVWRMDRAGWHRYESTRAWGEGLGESAVFGSAETIETLKAAIDDHETRLKVLERK